jgi:hypothetical protein
MFKLGRTLTNVKPPKSTEPQIETTPTPGNFRINSYGYEKMGLQLGDYIAITTATDEDEDGNPVSILLAYQGAQGDDESNNVGSKLGATNSSNAGSYSFSSRNSWNEMGGNEDEKVMFNILDGVELDGVTYFQLVEAGREDKVERKASN